MNLIGQFGSLFFCDETSSLKSTVVGWAIRATTGHY